ncbi:MAG: TPM domain-containing protein, partial [Sinomicrobium sp.]|nr:TPM domain-containing protein [Sinomicrobium sp.]
MILRYKNTLLLLLVLLFAQWSYSQFTIPDKPKKQTSVYDYADLLNADDERKLEQKLINYADTTSTQIVIAIIET